MNICFPFYQKDDKYVVMTQSQRAILLQAKNFLNDSSKSIGKILAISSSLHFKDDLERLFTLISAHKEMGALVFKPRTEFFDPLLVRKHLLCFKTDKMDTDIERIKYVIKAATQRCVDDFF